MVLRLAPILLAASSAHAFVLPGAPSRTSTRHSAVQSLDFFSQCEASRVHALLRLRGGGAPSSCLLPPCRRTAGGVPGHPLGRGQPAGSSDAICMVALAKRFEAIVHRPWKRLHAGGIQCGWARRRRYLRRSRSLRGCLDHEGSTAGEERREHRRCVW